ncbi:MAG: phosphomannomutase/phosphoglucomutase, partial [Deltaproteobacteria bacterium]|nr:phosphomannomutase/phosphoglucomutase [Deltaproteobacteria bacterium]
EKIFREYDIRGVADRDLPHNVVSKLGRAIGSYVKRKGGKTLTVGRDCRISSDRIRQSLIDGLLATGINVIDIGLVPTPLLYFSVFELNSDGGIMITGSHNPPEHNGFKICVGKTTIHGEEIQYLKQIVQKDSYESGKGTLSEKDIKPLYTSMILKNIKHPLNLKVCVDSGNGMGGMIGPEIFRKLGCEVVELFSDLDGRFPNHHPDPTVIENLSFLAEKVKQTNAVVGIGFDGDADRIGVVDPSGKPIYGDELLVVYAREILKENSGATIISEVKASHRLFNDIALHGGKPILWKTGHSLIKAKMKEEGALLAGEMSGHIFFNDRYYGFDDAIYAAARLLEILAINKKTTAELITDLPVSFSTPEIRKDCPDEIKFTVVERALKQFQSQGLKVNAIDGARVEFGDGWGLVRASNTQPVLVLRFEASSQDRLNEIRSKLENTVSSLLKELV